MYYGFLGEAPKVVGVVSDYVKRERQCEAELGVVVTRRVYRVTFPLVRIYTENRI